MTRGKISLVGVEITGSMTALSVGGATAACPRCGERGNLKIHAMGTGDADIECGSCGYRDAAPAPEQQTSGSSE